MLVAPVGTPAPIVDRISTDLAKVVTDADIKQKLGATGSYPRAMTAAQTATFVAQQQATWLPVLQGISQTPQAK